MKNTAKAKLLIFMLIMTMLTGCFGIDIEQYRVMAVVRPDLTGAYVVSAKITESEYISYMERNSLTDPKEAAEWMADDIAERLGWTFPYEVEYGTDGENLLLGLNVNFNDLETFCAFFPAADSETQSNAENALGSENIYYCDLSASSTPYTEVYTYTDTIYPGTIPGELTILLPGSIAETNGSRKNTPELGENGVSWSWNDQDVAVPMYLITAGLVDFDLEIAITTGTGGKTDVTVKATAPIEVANQAATLYPSGDSLQALADRLATGLNLSNYDVSAKPAGSQAEIILKMSGLSPEEVEAVLVQTGLMSSVTMKADAGLFKGTYEFSGNLSSWQGGVGYPDSVTLTVNLPGQAEPESFSANESQQPVSVVSESINWLGIIGVAVGCLLVLGGGAVVLGGGFFLMRRKKDKT
ncbi:MAG: hypothetical protein HYZ24_00235 [Chloroflexi bacterium]|nr:hypothetical protein [Chloroflexota bacterium]